MAHDVRALPLTIVLFFIGALLFVISFGLNAIAEFFVRNRLMKRFKGI